MAIADPPSPPPEPAFPPAPPELPPDSPPPPAETPMTMGAGRPAAEGAGAKPNAPGPVDPPGIAASVLPQRRQDAGHAGGQAASNDR